MPVTHYIFGGRFQPFHIGHLAVLTYAAQKFDGPIVIGIVNPDPKNRWPGDGDWLRFKQQDNPMTFWERFCQIKQSISHTEIDARVTAIVPEPRPSVNLQRANAFLPSRPRIFVLCARWGDEIEIYKSDRYRKLGEICWQVPDEDLGTDLSYLDGALVRNLMVLGNPIWKELVPAQSIPYLEEIHLVDRLRREVDVPTATVAVDNYLNRHPLGKRAPEHILNAIKSGQVKNLGQKANEAKPDVRTIVGKLRGSVLKDSLHRTNLSASERKYVEDIVEKLISENGIASYPKFFTVSQNISEIVMTKETLGTVCTRIERDLA